MLSLIIPSYNPALKLPETLNTLASQREFIDELILVIDHHNFDNFHPELLQKYKDTFNLKIVKQPDSGRAKSRNKGAEASSGDLLVFLDDDMLIADGLIEKHSQRHKDAGDIILTGNGYRNPAMATDDFRKYLTNMEKPWREKVKDIKEVSLDNFTFTACNMSVPRKIFFELDGFDTRFPDGEDFDFAVRALFKNFKIFYDNSLTAWHNDWPDTTTFINRQREYTNAKKIIFQAHPEYLEYFPHMLPVESKGIKKGIASLFKSPLKWFVTSGNVIFAGLPQKVKFFMYNYTIAFNSISNKS